MCNNNSQEELDMLQVLEDLGQKIDQLDSLAHGLFIPMKAETHVECIKSILPDTVTELKEIYVRISGENPWE